MKRRGSGILLHITSLFSSYGIGDLGPAAYRFVDFLFDAQQRYGQILPLNPTRPEFDNSPYLSTSAFAFNTNLISPNCMVHDDFIEKTEITEIPAFPCGTTSFSAVIEFKETVFTLAFERFRKKKLHDCRSIWSSAGAMPVGWRILHFFLHCAGILTGLSRVIGRRRR